MISACKQHVKQVLAGQNTQQIVLNNEEGGDINHESDASLNLLGKKMRKYTISQDRSLFRSS